MPTIPKLFILRTLRAIAIWFIVITVIILMYADDVDPMPISIFNRLLIAAGITAFFNIPVVKRIGRIYLNTTPDDGDADV
ncbi:hypothetical protein [Falsirhodobacter sp. alg1]|uniref:hypothetical protein n=1 Tax=Falsirhodobacter sp. alg1 TaxID=1472418 RepID=UPI001EDA7EF7|nr:hypothetical protein [Falsirhodobacter sp. alg1]